MRHLYFCSIFLISFTAPLWAERPAPKRPLVDGRLTEVLAQIQTAWDKIQSYECAFTQRVLPKTPGGGGKLEGFGGWEDETSGILLVKKPDKLRWEATSEGTLQILNGGTFTSVRLNRRTSRVAVDIYKDAKKSIDMRALHFLAGQMRFTEFYHVKLLSDGPKAVELKLTPKEDPSESYIAEMEKGSYLLRSLTTETLESRVRMEFMGVKVNPVIQNSMFEYKPGPKDTVHTH